MMLYMTITLLPLLTTALNCREERVCKIWSTCSANGTCSCGDTIEKAVQCSEEYLWIQPGYCMYYDHMYNKAVLGNCMLTLGSLGNITVFDRGSTYERYKRYSVKNSTMFNNQLCGSKSLALNREGRFCGGCKEGFGLAAYSYHYTTCIPCTDHGYKNWLRYFAVALLPLTLFYILIVLLKINVTSSQLNGLLFAVQSVISPIQIRLADTLILSMNQGKIHDSDHIYRPYSFMEILFRVGESAGGIANLDFFRSVYPYFCISPHLKFIHIVSLDFIIALYPFLLIFLTYLLITMYDNNYRLVVWAWKPFEWGLRHYQRQFSTRSSLIEIFATFILLSNVKILGVCFDLLALTRVYDATGAKLSSRFHYYDANIDYFGPEHLPFALLALFMGFVFVFLPFLLLVVYPCRCFQRCLNSLRWSCQALHIFMDAFQGSYKTEPTDLRYFSAYYLLLRFLLILLPQSTMSIFYMTLSSLLMVVSAFVFLLFEPYKTSAHNKVDMCLMLMLAVMYIGSLAGVFGSLVDYHMYSPGQVTFVFSFLLIIGYTLLVFIFIPLYRKLSTSCLKRLRSKQRDPSSETPSQNFDRDADEEDLHVSKPLLNNSSAPNQLYTRQSC